MVRQARQLIATRNDPAYRRIPSTTRGGSWIAAATSPAEGGMPSNHPPIRCSAADSLRALKDPPKLPPRHCGNDNFTETDGAAVVSVKLSFFSKLTSDNSIETETLYTAVDAVLGSGTP